MHNSNPEEQQACAWMAVCEVLNQVAPNWTDKPGMTGMQCAVAAIKELADARVPAGPAHRPFDLAAAKRGEPIVTRGGRKARFVAHVPDTRDEASRVIAMIEGDARPKFYDERGLLGGKKLFSGYDLFMAPKPKQTAASDHPSFGANVEFHPNGSRVDVTFEINGEKVKKAFERCALSEEWGEVICG